MFKGSKLLLNTQHIKAGEIIWAVSPSSAIAFSGI